RGVPDQGLLADRRGARPQRRRAHEALPRRHRPRQQTDGDMTFAGRQAIVTGAGSGIGAALCRALAAVGAEVLCTDLDEAAAAHTAERLGARSARLDVTDAAAVQAC